MIGAYHRLFEIEASFRMSKHDLRRPADLPPQARVDRGPPDASCSPRSRSAGSIEDRTGWSIRRFVRTARRYRTVQIRAGQQLLTAEDPLPDDLRDALALITEPEGAH